MIVDQDYYRQLHRRKMKSYLPGNGVRNNLNGSMNYQNRYCKGVTQSTIAQI